MITIAAPNRQPSGSRPGPKAAEVHAPQKGKLATNQIAPGDDRGHSGEKGLASHGTPKGVGANKSNPLH